MIFLSSILPLLAFSLCIPTTSYAFVQRTTSKLYRGRESTRTVILSSSSVNENPESINRRDAIHFVGSITGLLVSTSIVRPVHAAESSIFLAGATGQTGRRILERLASRGSCEVVGGVRDLEKANKSLGDSSIIVRGAMIQNVPSIDTSAVTLKHLDVVKDSVDEITETLSGISMLVIATGFVPGNPMKMNAAAHEVDNVGTIKLIDAAKKAGSVKKIVLVSSILTNGRNWGQANSPGFVVTNAFGNVLDEKLIAENYLKSSGINYSIVRPGGLKSKKPTGTLKISPEDTLNSGEISRDLVADVCIACLTDPKASNKVLEIIEDENIPTETSRMNALDILKNF